MDRFKRDQSEENLIANQISDILIKSIILQRLFDFSVNPVSLLINDYSKIHETNKSNYLFYREVIV